MIRAVKGGGKSVISEDNQYICRRPPLPVLFLSAFAVILIMFIWLLIYGKELEIQHAMRMNLTEADYLSRQTRDFLVAVLASVAIAGSVLLVTRMMLRKERVEEELRLVNERLEETVAERTRELQLMNEKLRRLSLLDGLTNIANRRYLDEYLQREWRLMMRQGKTLGLIMADIDFFKPYNDTYGHQAGDECLRQVAKALGKGLKRATDFVARYGGEEFVIVISDADEVSLLQQAERLKTLVETLAIPHEGSVHRWVTVSMGVAAMAPGRDDLVENLFDQADMALYEAKRAGGNCVIQAQSIEAKE